MRQGALDCLSKTFRNEGLRALYKGFEPAIIRQVVYGGLRYGLYAPIRNAIGVDVDTPKHQIPFYKKFIAGGGAGAVASFIANPTDMVKVQMQVQGMDGTKGTGGFIATFFSIVKNEGVTGLWRGSLPNLTRATVLAAFELSCYDEIKKRLKGIGLIQEGEVSGVFVSALATGFIASVVSNPLDVLKSRVMGQSFDPVTKKGLLYDGMVDCARKSFKADGAAFMWSGFWPCYARLGPRAVTIFLVMEQLKKQFG